MKLRNIALAFTLAATGAAFATTTRTTTVTRDPVTGTVTRHVVKVNNNDTHRRHVKHVVVYKAPVHHRHHRHYASMNQHRHGDRHDNGHHA